MNAPQARAGSLRASAGTGRMTDMREPWPAMQGLRRRRGARESLMRATSRRGGGLSQRAATHQGKALRHQSEGESRASNGLETARRLTQPARLRIAQVWQSMNWQGKRLVRWSVCLQGACGRAVRRVHRSSVRCTASPQSAVRKRRLRQLGCRPGSIFSCDVPSDGTYRESRRPRVRRRNSCGSRHDDGAALWLNAKCSSRSNCSRKARRTDFPLDETLQRFVRAVSQAP